MGGWSYVIHNATSTLDAASKALAWHEAHVLPVGAGVIITVVLDGIDLKGAGYIEHNRTRKQWDYTVERVREWAHPQVREE